jgi:hypothetical protein
MDRIPKVLTLNGSDRNLSKGFPRSVRSVREEQERCRVLHRKLITYMSYARIWNPAVRASPLWSGTTGYSHATKDLCNRQKNVAVLCRPGLLVARGHALLAEISRATSQSHTEPNTCRCRKPNLLTKAPRHYMK